MSGEMTYDEDAAVKFIRALLPADRKDRYDDDEIMYVVDIMYDWYEKNGYLSLDSDVTDEEAVDVDKLTDYVRKQIKKDGEVEMDPDDIGLIVKGELEYEETLEDFV